MAAPYNPPTRGEDFVFFLALGDMSNPGRGKAAPTIASGDFKVSKDGGALANLATLPTNEPSGSVWVKVVLSATEMTADNVSFQAIDQDDPPQWADSFINIVTVQ